MFDQFKNLSGLAGIMKNAGQIREQLAELQEELKHRRVEAETGGGAVRVTASGAMRVVKVEVDPAMLKALVDTESEADRAMAGDLIAGAVNAALEKAQREAAEELSRRAGEMGLPLPPGTDIGRMLGGGV
ncbi:MAG: YbaB/EbfC family nucleoid-associated protein [Phycisphaerales bacterium]